MAARMLTQENSWARRGRDLQLKTAEPTGKAAMSTDTEVVAYRKDFLREAAAFEQKLPELLVKFPDEYVAIFEGEVIDHDADWEVLAEKVHQRIPDRFVLLEQVLPKSQKVVHIDYVGVQG